MYTTDRRHTFYFPYLLGNSSSFYKGTRITNAVSQRENLCVSSVGETKDGLVKQLVSTNTSEL